MSIKLDEPRELYMSFWSESFDIWSCKSAERQGKVRPEAHELRIKTAVQALNPMEQTFNYLEKMPEHILRVDLISEALPGAQFICMSRDWVQVALSIHKICANSRQQHRWYGARAAKWNALKAYVTNMKAISE